MIAEVKSSTTTRRSPQRRDSERDRIIRALINIPANDVNFKSALERADLDMVTEAVTKAEQEPTGNKTRLQKLRSRLKALQPEPKKEQEHEFKKGDCVEVICPEGFVHQAFAPAGATGIVTCVGQRKNSKGSFYVHLDLPPGKGKKQDVLISGQRLQHYQRPSDLELTWRDLHPRDLVRHRSGKPFLYGQNKIWTSYVTDVSAIDVGVCYTTTPNFAFTHLRATERHPFEDLELLERYDPDTQKHIPLMQFEPGDRVRYIVDHKLEPLDTEYVIVDAEDDYYTLHKIPRFSTDAYVNIYPEAYAEEITRIGKVDFDTLHPKNQKRINRWRTDRQLTEMLKEHGFDRLGRSEDSDHADEDLESYGDWEIFDDGSVDLIHRPSKGWWSIAGDQIPIVSEGKPGEDAAWAKTVIDAIESQINILPRLKELLEGDGFVWMGSSTTSGYGAEEMEAYKDWDIYLDIPNGGMLAVDLIHRPTRGWWGIPTEGRFDYHECDEAIAWAKTIIDAIEAKLGNEPEQTDLSTIAPNASLDDQISQTYQNLCQAEDTWHQAAKATVQLYFELGEQLNRRKAVTAHGEWGNCLVSFGIHSERAQRAMRIARYFDGKSDRLTDLTLTQALDEIAQSKSQQMSLPVSPPALPRIEAEHDRPSNDFHPQETDGSESSPYTEFSAAQENPPAPEEKPVRTKRMPQPPPPICYWEQPEYLATVNPKECSIEIQGKAIAGQIVAVSMDWQLGTVKAAIVNHANGQVQLPMSKVTLIQDIDMEASK
jgi:transcription antitermination factor NusG